MHRVYRRHRIYRIAQDCIERAAGQPQGRPSRQAAWGPVLLLFRRAHGPSCLVAGSARRLAGGWPAALSMCPMQSYVSYVSCVSYISYATLYISYGRTVVGRWSYGGALTKGKYWETHCGSRAGAAPRSNLGVAMALPELLYHSARVVWTGLFFLLSVPGSPHF